MTEGYAQDLFDLAQPFLMALNDKPAARDWLAAYNMRVLFSVTGGEAFHMVVRGGRVEEVERGGVEAFSLHDDMEFFGPEEGFRLVFERQATPATVLSHGKLTPRGERAKHCQAVVVLRLLRLGQEPAWKEDLG